MNGDLMDVAVTMGKCGSKQADSCRGLVRFFNRPYPECSRLRWLIDTCCHTCLHCSTSGKAAAAEDGWCRLRRLPVHADLARLALCHHWTARPPVLPRLRALDPPGGRADVQLELERAMPVAAGGEA